MLVPATSRTPPNLGRAPEVTSNFVVRTLDRQYSESRQQAAVASLDDLMTFLAQRPDFHEHAAAVTRYRQEYGVARAG